MSTEIKTKAKGITLNQFSGGTENGVMISINQKNFFEKDFDENNRA